MPHPSIAQFGPGDRVLLYGEVTCGSAVLFAVHLTADSAVGATINAHGQATSPTSPYYAADAAHFASGEWRPLRYSPAEIAASPEQTTLTVEGN